MSILLGGDLPKAVSDMLMRTVKKNANTADDNVVGHVSAKRGAKCAFYPSRSKHIL